MCRSPQRLRTSFFTSTRERCPQHSAYSSCLPDVTRAQRISRLLAAPPGALRCLREMRCQSLPRHLFCRPWIAQGLLSDAQGGGSTRPWTRSPGSSRTYVRATLIGDWVVCGLLGSPVLSAQGDPSPMTMLHTPACSITTTRDDIVLRTWFERMCACRTTKVSACPSTKARPTVMARLGKRQGLHSGSRIFPGKPRIGLIPATRRPAGVAGGSAISNS